ncbi:MAG: hypothetical protein MZV64_29535 [Ignavibacteriales bacterium]|nr:hypothetical protein [Ignavibacteriales bacterium]
MVPPPVQYCRPSRLLSPAVCLLLFLAGSVPAEAQMSAGAPPRQFGRRSRHAEHRPERGHHGPDGPPDV